MMLLDKVSYLLIVFWVNFNHRLHTLLLELCVRDPVRKKTYFFFLQRWECDLTGKDSIKPQRLKIFSP